MNRNRSIASASRLSQGVIVVYVSLAALLLTAIAAPSLRLIVLAFASVAIMSVPFLGDRKIDWFSPWNWLFYWTFLGVLLRAIYITFDFPSALTIDARFLRGQPKDFLLEPMVTVFLGLMFMVFGYLVGPEHPRRVPFRVFESDRWNRGRLWFVVLAMLLLSWLGFYLYIRSTGVNLNTDSLSATRTLANDLSEYRAHGYSRWLVSLSAVACYLMVAKTLSSGRWRLIELLVIVLSGATSLFFYYFVQTRSGIVVVLLSLVAIRYYIRGRRFPLKEAIVVGSVALITLAVMTARRPGSGYELADLSDALSIRAIEPLVVNTNGIDVSKTAHIMAAVGKQLDFEWGRTLLNVFMMWVPRQMWPSKPVNVDTTIGMAVFGSTTYGAGAVPPGLVAEMYWNFWFPGVIAGCFLNGVLQRFLYTQFRAYRGNRNVILWYVASFMGLGSALMGSGVSSAIMAFLMSSLPLVVAVRFITEPNARKRQPI